MAEGICRIPLLWIALFRWSDMRCQTLAVRQFTNRRQTGLAPPSELVQLEYRAPFAMKETAIAQLNASLPHLNRLFSECGILDDHASMLCDAINKTPGRFVTLEIDEILERENEADFAILHKAMTFLDEPLLAPTPIPSSFFSRLFSRPKDPTALARREFVSLSGVKPKYPFRSPIGFWDDPDINQDEMLNLSALLGTQLFRPVPWEPTEHQADGVEDDEG
ncbi:MAG: hypothetical protein K8T25_24335 [Planctomycetia bacterium]|nr:hypothetical protein [Planctomycetia bacterium]